ncbi:hypothetical protein N181_29965 [Sinorhizobium fredii USDA 205]|nr:hypothetical protein N181_29965 [Sinorhizobium fredii USDA 205]
MTRSSGGIGCLAMWQWIHSMGSEAVNGSVPVSISYSVTPGTVHATRLLGRHIGKRSRDYFWRLGRPSFTRQARGNAEAKQPQFTAVNIDQDVGWLDILVYQPAAM